jgi:hypothetical protein
MRPASRHPYSERMRRQHTLATERNLFATPLFWGGIAFLSLVAVAGSLVVVGAGPSVAGAIAGIVVALIVLSIGVVLALAVAAPRVLRGPARDGDWGYW